MFDDWAWKSYVNVMTEAKEPTPFKSKAQKRYKKLRYKNDIYTRNGGIKNKASGAPYSGDLQRFGTSSLRFESLTEEVIDGLDVSSLKPQDTLSPVLWLKHWDYDCQAFISSYRTARAKRLKLFA